MAPTVKAPTSAELKGKIQAAVKKRQGLSSLYGELGKQYGGAAIPPLLELSKDEKISDDIRWASLYGLARLAGKESIGVISKFMTNSSWMLRDAALKSAAALNAQELSEQIERRLQDSALIVRTTAVQAIGHMKMKAAAPKLVDALFDPANYNGGKPLWIHKYILQVLTDFRYEPAVPKLVSLLERSKDEKLRNQIVGSLETITGKSFAGRPMSEQIYLWKRNALSESTF
jgi:hypothetical protein